jgi:hypothetical protein
MNSWMMIGALFVGPTEDLNLPAAAFGRGSMLYKIQGRQAVHALSLSKKK